MSKRKGGNPRVSVQDELSESISNLDKARIRKIIRANPSICTSKGFYPLIELMYFGGAGYHGINRLDDVFEIGDILINEGKVDVNSVDSSITCTTALSIAAIAGSLEKIEYLLDRGAEAYSERWKITAQSYPLFMAIRHSNKYAVELLLSHGADPNATEKESKNSTFYHAINISNNYIQQRYDICKVLLEMGARVNQQCFYFDKSQRKNVRGSALSYALSVAGDDEDLIRLLKQSGGIRRIAEV